MAGLVYWCDCELVNVVVRLATCHNTVQDLVWCRIWNFRTQRWEIFSNYLHTYTYLLTQKAEWYRKCTLLFVHSAWSDVILYLCWPSVIIAAPTLLDRLSPKATYADKSLAFANRGHSLDLMILNPLSRHPALWTPIITPPFSATKYKYSTPEGLSGYVCRQRNCIRWKTVFDDWIRRTKFPTQTKHTHTWPG